jgi:putative hydrolase of the HAD superfamily
MMKDAAVHHGRTKTGEAPAMSGIIFDFGGVFTKTHPRDVILHRCEDQLGLPRGALLGLLFVGEQWWLMSTGSISADDYWQRICDALGGQVPAALEPFKHNPFAYEELNGTMVALVRRLHRRFRIGLLSNATPYLEVLIEQNGLAYRFDTLVNSARVGLRKPDPEIYRLTVARLELEPQQCLFVDDKERNTEVAQALGMKAVVFRSAANLERQLRDRHVLY